MTLFSVLSLLVLIAAPSPAFEGASDALRQYEKELQKIARQGETAALSSFIDEVAALRDPRAVLLIPKAALAAPSAELYRKAILALAAKKRAEPIEQLIAYLEKPRVDDLEKRLILVSFGHRRDALSRDAIIAQMESRSAAVQTAAAIAAGLRKDKGCIPPLLDLLEDRDRARDRTWLACRDSLSALTGQDYEVAEDWRKYWDTARETLDPEKIGEHEGPTVVGGATQFFGAEICSSRLIFVIDVSGTMLMYDESEEYKGRNPERDRQRLWRAQVQLVRALKKLPRGAKFNIIAFADKVMPWKTRLQSVSRSNLSSAAGFVASFKPKGATHTDEALEVAFQDPDVDTIVLLSDGAPEKKDQPYGFEIIPKIHERVRDLNASRGIVIHTFGFLGIGEWPKRVPWAKGQQLPKKTETQVAIFVEFLKELARNNGGFFRPIR